MARNRVTRRGWVSGVLLMLLGAWGALVPFVGPYFSFAYTPDVTWTYNSGRLWLSVVPGAVTFLGGLLLILLKRAGAVGGLLAALGGVWFVIGQHVTAIYASSISPGSPATAANSAFNVATTKFLEGLGFFYGLGVLIVFVAALGVGRAVSAGSADDTYPELDDNFEETKAYSTPF